MKKDTGYGLHWFDCTPEQRQNRKEEIKKGQDIVFAIIILIILTIGSLLVCFQ